MLQRECCVVGEYANESVSCDWGGQGAAIVFEGRTDALEQPRVVVDGDGLERIECRKGVRCGTPAHDQRAAAVAQCAVRCDGRKARDAETSNVYVELADIGHGSFLTGSARNKKPPRVRWPATARLMPKRYNLTNSRCTPEPTVERAARIHAADGTTPLRSCQPCDRVRKRCFFLWVATHGGGRRTSGSGDVAARSTTWSFEPPAPGGFLFF